MQNILVFPCRSEVGLEVYEAFKNNPNFRLFGLNSIPDHGMYVYENYIGDIEYYDSPNFLINLNKIIKKYKISIIYPTMDSVIAFLKEN